MYMIVNPNTFQFHSKLYLNPLGNQKPSLYPENPPSDCCKVLAYS